MDMNRRSFLKGTIVSAAGALSVAALGGCAPASKTNNESLSSTGETASTNATAAGRYSFEVAPDPITDVAEAQEADVVVVGAGTSGLVTALSSLQHGLSVVVVTASEAPVSRGGLHQCSL